MNQQACPSPLSARIGAVFFAMWGLLHIIGGMALLRALSQEGSEAFLLQVGSAADEAALGAVPANTVSSAILSYHAYNLAWMGLLALLVAIFANWKNSLMGYLVNVFLIGAVDLGLYVYLLNPAFMKWSDGGIGISLFFLGLGCSTIGIFHGRPQSARN